MLQKIDEVKATIKFQMKKVLCEHNGFLNLRKIFRSLARVFEKLTESFARILCKIRENY